MRKFNVTVWVDNEKWRERFGFVVTVKAKTRVEAKQIALLDVKDCLNEFPYQGSEGCTFECYISDPYLSERSRQFKD